MAQNRAKMGQKWAIWSDFGPFFCDVLGSLWGQFGIVLASFWGLFRPFLGHFWGLFGCFFLGGVLRSGFLVVHWGFQCKKWANRGNIMQKYAIFRQNWKEKVGKFDQKQAFFGYKTLVLLKKKRSRSTFQPMKVCSKWVCLEVSWVDFECFYALWWRSRWLLSGFYVPFHYFWQYLSLFRAKNGPKWPTKGPK